MGEPHRNGGYTPKQSNDHDRGKYWLRDIYLSRFEEAVKIGNYNEEKRVAERLKRFNPHAEKEQ